MASDFIKGISGQIVGVHISSFLQMIEMEKKTCTIKVFAKKKIGKIYFLNGSLSDAKTANKEHMEALFSILSWKNIIIEVEKNESRRKNKINLPLMHILIKSAQESDEQKDTDSPNGSDHEKTIPTKTISLQTVETGNFCLETGSRLLIDLNDPAVSFRSLLVGIEAGKYLLLKAPSPFESMDHEVLKKNDLIIKSLYKGTIYAFRSRLLDMISNPTRLMFVEYPKKVEHYELRSHKRFKCSIVAQTQVENREHGGVIENISRGGCRCIVELYSADYHLPDELINRTISFRCRLPGSDREICFDGEIKNARKKTEEIAVGIKFVYSDDKKDVQQIINDYIRLIEYSGTSV